jgi:aspartate/methionine/tyrosine aminotransferase
VFSVYSSSVASLAIAAALASRDMIAAILHPTFDNIHDLMVKMLRVVPVPESLDATATIKAARSAAANAIVLTTPNNPTGRLIDRTSLTEFARQCLEHDLTLCLDTSFRGFDDRTQYDHYAILERTGVKYIVIEDTGKLWPVSELKLGFIAVSEHWRSAVEHALSDILLTVSPFVLVLVRELSQDAERGGLRQLQALISDNRQTVRVSVADLPGVAVLDEDARVSVSRIAFPDARQADNIRAALRDRGVHVLPCGQFYWNNPREGARVIRVALARDREVITSACHMLADTWRTIATAEAV